MLSTISFERSEPAPGTIDRNGLEVLSRDECLALLGTVRIGRVGLSMRALPVVLPVTFTLLDENVVFRTGTGTKLAAAVANAVIAFEADDFDLDRDSGWSVCLTGRADEMLHPSELAKVAGLDLHSVVRDSASRVMRIRSDIVTGRRLHRG